MQDTVFEVYQEKNKGTASDVPVIGQDIWESKSAKPMESTVIKYFVGCLTNESNLILLEEIMTKSLRCHDQLAKVGDILVLSEVGGFDKDGCYNVVVKYLEIVEDKDA